MCVTWWAGCGTWHCRCQCTGDRWSLCQGSCLWSTSSCPGRSSDTACNIWNNNYLHPSTRQVATTHLWTSLFLIGQPVVARYSWLARLTITLLVLGGWFNLHYEIQDQFHLRYLYFTSGPQEIWAGVCLPSQWDRLPSSCWSWCDTGHHTHCCTWVQSAHSDLQLSFKTLFMDLYFSYQMCL